jgi:hypothetical protein
MSPLEADMMATPSLHCPNTGRAGQHMQECSGNWGFPPAGACCPGGSHQEAARLGISGHGPYKASARACSTSCSSILLVKKLIRQMSLVQVGLYARQPTEARVRSVIISLHPTQPQHSSVQERLAMSAPLYDRSSSASAAPTVCADCTPGCLCIMRHNSI